ncbi:MAG: sensor signal transduction histidine kinase [Sporomusa sp.]|jgi:PAS domain S-box-containing protein|nr:sensor signal transduction histidine kinase [Sporomusa sp.]
MTLQEGSAIVKFNLQTKMMIAIVALLTSVCMVIGISTVTNVRQQISVAITEKAKSDTKTSLEIVDLLYPGPWKNQNNVLYKGNMKITDNTEIVDYVAALTGNEITIFLHDTRVTTTIIQDDKRAVGTKAADNVFDTVFNKNQTYSGEADVLGIKYHANYTPITDANGQVIGMFYEGVSKQFADELERSFFRSFGGFVLFSLLLSSLAAGYLGRKITRPITRMAGMVEQITDGNLSVNVTLDGTTQDEVGRLATNFNKMAIQLRKREESLRESEERYHSLVDNLNIGVYRSTPNSDNGFIKVNPALVKMLGYTFVEEFVKILPVEHFQNPEDRKRFTEDVIRNGFVKGKELILRKRDGTPIWVSFTTTAQYDEQGNTKWLDGVVEDISDRKLIEESLKTANKQLEDIIEFLPDATLIVNKDKTIIAWNRAMEEITGVIKADILGKDHRQGMIPFYGEPRSFLIDLFEKEDSELTSKYDYVQKKANILYSEVFAPGLYNNKGASIWATASPLLDSEGNIIGVIEVVRDITERKRTEVALRQAHNELETKVEQRTQDLFAVNAELTAMYGELQAANRGLHNEIAERRWAEKQLEQKNRELEKAYAELKCAQSRLVQNEKMAGIGQLAAGVAHEINNPLGFILSNFATLEKYISRLLEIVSALRELHRRVLEEKSLPLQQEAESISAILKQRKLDYILEDLEPIFRETNDGLNRVGNIIKALRLFSRIDQQYNFEDFDLNESVENSLTVARNEVKYIAEVKMKLTKIPSITAVGSQISQVLLNIILNAAYAIKGKGLDTLGLITISTYADDLFAYCSIEDNGTGIPKEVKKDIFNPFFTTKPVGQGTGLGLSISYDIIVTKHHGEISVTSEVGIGTTFTIKLPLVQRTDA